jgi:hypothetical protein
MTELKRKRTVQSLIDCPSKIANRSESSRLRRVAAAMVAARGGDNPVAAISRDPELMRTLFVRYAAIPIHGVRFAKDVDAAGASAVDEFTYDAKIPAPSDPPRACGFVARGSSDGERSSVVSFRMSARAGHDFCVATPDLVVRASGKNWDRLIQAWTHVSPGSIANYAARTSDPPDAELRSAFGFVCGDAIVAVRSDIATVEVHRVERAWPLASGPAKRQKRPPAAIGTRIASLKMSSGIGGSDIIDDVRTRGTTLFAAAIRCITGKRRTAIVSSADASGDDSTIEQVVLEGTGDALLVSLAPGCRTVFVAEDSGDALSILRYEIQGPKVPAGIEVKIPKLPTEDVDRRVLRRLVALSDNSFLLCRRVGGDATVVFATTSGRSASFSKVAWMERRDCVLYVGTDARRISAIDVHSGDLLGDGVVPDLVTWDDPPRKFPMARSKGGLISERFGDVTSVFY